MSHEQRKAAVRYWYLVAGAGDIERNAYLRVRSAAFGPDSLMAVVTSLRQAFPDLRFAIDSQTVEGDQVLTHWTAAADRTGPALAVPICLPLHLQGASVERFEGDWLVESHMTFALPDTQQDVAGRVLPALPSPGRFHEVTRPAERGL